MNKKRLFIGIPLLAFPVLFLTGLIESPTTLTLFMLFWMVLWWTTEIIPLGITALIPLIYLPFMGLANLKQVAQNYSNPVIYLFLGGFILARGLSKTGLDKRIALTILKFTGKSDAGIILGFVIATGFLSMWISNTATTVMMVPIALSVLHFLEGSVDLKKSSSFDAFSTVLFLSIAYSANIGGIMTPVGTPPNVVFVGYLEELYSIQIDFWKWMIMTVPIAATLLFVQTIFLRKLFPFQVPVPTQFRDHILNEIRALGPMRWEQKLTLMVFSFVCLLWIFKGPIHYLIGFKFLQDASVAVLGGLLLFFLPKDNQWNEGILDRTDISHLPWNIVLLFGGGMALAGALKEAHLIQLTTDYLSSFDLRSKYILVFLIAGVVLFLTEIMSNVALCVVALPVIMKLGVSYDLSPVLIGVPATLCASFAFSMPISTPPNAIVFGSEKVKMRHMLRAGIPMNFIGWFVVMSVGWGLLKFFSY